MLKEVTISKQKIVNAFTELSEESSLEQINTTDIIKKVSLSRPTFYYYSNQDNLVETTLSKILDKVSSILQKYMTYQKGVLTEMLRYLKEKGVKSFGLHAFLASNTVTNEYYPTLAAQLFELAVEIKNELGISLDFINLSGGVGNSAVI